MLARGTWCTSTTLAFESTKQMESLCKQYLCLSKMSQYVLKEAQQQEENQHFPFCLSWTE